MYLLTKVNNFISSVGKPKSILSDNGTQFRSIQWKEHLTWNNIKPIFITTYHPANNPSERVMKELGRILRTYCYDKHTTWSTHINNIEECFNNSVHFSTSFTPEELIFGVNESFLENK